MFEHLRRTLRDLLEGRVAPADRRAVLAQMKDTLVEARVGLADLRSGIDATRARLAFERRELETVERRKKLAEGIGDAETVAVAERYERLHAERVAVLLRKLEAQDAERQLVEAEVETMTTELKSAMAGVGASSSFVPEQGIDPTELDDSERLREELDQMGRTRRRDAAEASAEEKLAALKRRMGK